MDTRYVMTDSSYRNRLLYPNPADYILPYQLQTGSNSLDSQNPTTQQYPVYNFRWNSTSFVFPSNYASPTYYSNGISTPDSVLQIVGGSPQAPILNQKIQDLIGLSGYPQPIESTTSPPNSSSTTLTQAKDMLRQSLLVNLFTRPTQYAPMTTTLPTNTSFGTNPSPLWTQRRTYTQYDILSPDGSTQAFPVSAYDPSLKLLFLTGSMSSTFSVQKPIILSNLPYTPDFQSFIVNESFYIGLPSSTSTTPVLVSTEQRSTLFPYQVSVDLPQLNILYPVGTLTQGFLVSSSWPSLFNTTLEKIPDTIQEGYWRWTFPSLEVKNQPISLFMKPYLRFLSITGQPLPLIYDFGTEATCEILNFTVGSYLNPQLSCYLPTTSLYSVLYQLNLILAQQTPPSSVPYDLSRVVLAWNVYAYNTIETNGQLSLTYAKNETNNPNEVATQWTTIQSTILQLLKTPSTPIEILLLGYDVDTFTNFNILTLLVGQESSNDGFRINASSTLALWDLTKNIICEADLVINALRLPLIPDRPNQNQIPNYFPNDSFMVFVNSFPEMYGELARFGYYIWNRGFIGYQHPWIQNNQPFFLTIDNGNYTNTSLLTELQNQWIPQLNRQRTSIPSPVLQLYTYFGIYWNAVTRTFWMYNSAIPVNDTTTPDPQVRLRQENPSMWFSWGINEMETQLLSIPGYVFLPEPQVLSLTQTIPSTFSIIFPLRSTSQNNQIVLRVNGTLCQYTIPLNLQFNSPQELQNFFNSSPGPQPSASTSIPFPSSFLFLSFTRERLLPPSTYSIEATPVVMMTTNIQPGVIPPSTTPTFGSFFQSLGVFPTTRRRTSLLLSSLPTPSCPYVRSASIGQLRLLSPTSRIITYQANMICRLVYPSSLKGNAYIRIDQCSSENQILSWTMLDPGYNYFCCDSVSTQLWFVPISISEKELNSLVQDYSSSDTLSSWFATGEVTEWKSIVKMKTTATTALSQSNFIEPKGNFLYLHACSGAWTAERYNYVSSEIQQSPSLYVSPNRSVPRPTPSKISSFTFDDAYTLYGTCPIFMSFPFEQFEPRTQLIQLNYVTQDILNNLTQLEKVPENLFTIQSTLLPDIVTANRCALLLFFADTSRQLTYTGSTVSSTQMVCYNIRVASLVIPNQDLDLANGGLTSSYPYMFVEWSNVTASSAHNRYLMYSNNPNAIFATFTCPISDVNAPTTTKYIKIFSAGSQQMKYLPNDNLRFRVFMPDGETFTTLFRDYLPPLLPNPFLQLSALFEMNRM